jgi:hypothetical protein
MYVSLYTDVPVSNAVLGRNLRLRTRAKYASSRDLTSGLSATITQDYQGQLWYAGILPSLP